MSYSTESADLPEGHLLPGSNEPIHRLNTLISDMPEIMKQAQAVNSLLKDRSELLKFTVSEIIDQFQVQKKIMLQHFDQWIHPIAQEILNGLLSDAERLKVNLEEKLEHIDELSAESLERDAQEWAHLFARWSDKKGLIASILEAVADRTAHLIDKDIQIISDYKTQSLFQVGGENDAFESVETRLTHAIEEPLKQLMGLRREAQEQTSIQQASEWIANLQAKRESCFEQLLMKIDHVMKDNVQIGEINDWSPMVELEGEILFLERELEHITKDMEMIAEIEESDREFLLARLEGLDDHLDEISLEHCPIAVQSRIKKIRAAISEAYSRF